MTNPGHDLNVPVERVTFRDGQRLDARDLDDALSRDQLLNALHHLAFHDAWGIALGFEVREVDGQAIVDPGYAVDAMGRALLLSDGFAPRIPRLPNPEIRVLTARYRQTAYFRSNSSDNLVANLCQGSGLAPRQERPAFAWRRQEEVRFGPEIPLVQTTLADGHIQGELDFRVRRLTRPHVRPHMAQGKIEAGGGAWRTWREGGRTLGLEMEIETSDAGFNRTPFYFATLSGDFSNHEEQAQPITADDVWADSSTSFGLDAVTFIVSASRDSFLFRLLSTDAMPLSVPTDPLDAEARGLSVTWLGIEPVRGCPPPFFVHFWVNPAGFPIVLNALTVNRAQNRGI